MGGPLDGRASKPPWGGESERKRRKIRRVETVHVVMLACTRCEQTMHHSEFVRDRSRTRGWSYDCKPCRAAKAKVRAATPPPARRTAMLPVQTLRDRYRASILDHENDYRLLPLGRRRGRILRRATRDRVALEPRHDRHVRGDGGTHRRPSRGHTGRDLGKPVPALVCDEYGILGLDP